jgi:hypothetical protein
MVANNILMTLQFFASNKPDCQMQLVTLITLTVILPV